MFGVTLLEERRAFMSYWTAVEETGRLRPSGEPKHCKHAQPAEPDLKTTLWSDARAGQHWLSGSGALSPAQCNSESLPAG